MFLMSGLCRHNLVYAFTQAWNFREVQALLCSSKACVLALAGHDHLGMVAVTASKGTMCTVFIVMYRHGNRLWVRFIASFIAFERLEGQE